MATITLDEQAGMQRARIDRALTEGEEFGIVMDSSGEFAHVFNPRSGKFYRVTESECTCGDWTWRGSRTGVACKHMCAVLARQEVK